MTAKKIPMRMCLGCGEMKPKRELMRIVRSPEGDVFADETGKKNGRGAYMCRSAECVKKARKSRRLEKTFSCKVESDVYDMLESAAEKASENES